VSFEVVLFFCNPKRQRGQTFALVTPWVSEEMVPISGVGTPFPKIRTRTNQCENRNNQKTLLMRYERSALMTLKINVPGKDIGLD
jgi:hypothetical protein